MRRIAHLSDVHMLDAQFGTNRAGYRLATKFVALGRGVDPGVRRRRLARALGLAKANGADHVVISGDLTEVGAHAEFEHIAEVLHEARLPEDSVTLVPGNHDAYTAADAWSKAMAGPLAPFARSSATTAGKVVDRGPIAFFPIDTSFFQNIACSAGEFTRATADALDRRFSDPAMRDKALVLVVHHPPMLPHVAMRLFDGLRGCAEVLDLLARHPRLQLLHGHLHRVVDRILATSNTAALRLQAVAGRGRGPTRVFGAPAICDGPDEAPKIRLYDLHEGALSAVELTAA